MIKTCVFRKPTVSNDNFDIIHRFNLNKLLSNNRTSIYSNDEMRVSIDKKVIRVLIYDDRNITLLEKLRGYFYGDEYQ